MSKILTTLLCISVAIISSGYVNSKTICEDGKADVVFLVDASGSVGAANFEIIRTFLANITLSLDISTTTTQIGMMRFETGVQHIFNLDDYSNADDVSDAIMAMGYPGGATNTHLALEKFRNEAFTSSNGGRADQGFLQIGVFITDGASSNKQLTLEQAALIHNSTNIFMVAVGISGAVSEELNATATDPDSDNVYYKAEFTDLESIQEEIVRRLCANSPGGRPILCSTPECMAMGGIPLPGGHANMLMGNAVFITLLALCTGMMKTFH